MLGESEDVYHQAFDVSSKADFYQFAENVVA